jgi:hypothetical protein
MHSIDYRLANALQERRLDEVARLHGDSQDSRQAESQPQVRPLGRLRPWLYELGGYMMAYGRRLERQSLLVQAGQEQRR